MKKKTDKAAPKRGVVSAISCSAGDHSGLKCADVIAYLRNEATRDVADHIPATMIIWMLRGAADYLQSEYEQNHSHHAEPRFGGDSVDGVVLRPNSLQP